MFNVFTKRVHKLKQCTIKDYMTKTMRLDSQGVADYHKHDTRTEGFESSFVHLTEFEMLTEQDVKSLMRYSSLKSCVLDPMPSTSVSRCDVLLPVLTRLINMFLKSGQFPVAWKEALVLPLLKKPAKINIDHILIGDSVIRPKGVVKNLGTWLDSTLSMNSHVNNTCSNAFYYLYNMRRIRKYLSRRFIETLIHAFVSGRVDYCNSLLYGLPTYQLNKLQRVQNAAARLIFKESKYCHVTDCCSVNLHWLPVKFQIDITVNVQGYQWLRAFLPPGSY